MNKTSAPKPTWRVECIRGFRLKRSRKFTSAEAAVRFANTFLDDNYESNWDVQIVTPSGEIYQMGINGNNVVGEGGML